MERDLRDNRDIFSNINSHGMDRLTETVSNFKVSVERGMDIQTEKTKEEFNKFISFSSLRDEKVQMQQELMHERLNKVISTQERLERGFEKLDCAVTRLTELFATQTQSLNTFMALDMQQLNGMHVSSSAQQQTSSAQVSSLTQTPSQLRQILHSLPVRVDSSEGISTIPVVLESETKDKVIPPTSSGANSGRSAKPKRGPARKTETVKATDRGRKTASSKPGVVKPRARPVRGKRANMSAALSRLIASEDEEMGSESDQMSQLSSDEDDENDSSDSDSKSGRKSFKQTSLVFSKKATRGKPGRPPKEVKLEATGNKKARRRVVSTTRRRTNRSKVELDEEDDYDEGEDAGEREDDNDADAIVDDADEEDDLSDSVVTKKKRNSKARADRLSQRKSAEPSTLRSAKQLEDSVMIIPDGIKDPNLIDLVKKSQVAPLQLNRLEFDKIFELTLKGDKSTNNLTFKEMMPARRHLKMTCTATYLAMLYSTGELIKELLEKKYTKGEIEYGILAFSKKYMSPKTLSGFLFWFHSNKVPLYEDSRDKIVFEIEEARKQGDMPVTSRLIAQNFPTPVSSRGSNQLANGAAAKIPTQKETVETTKNPETAGVSGKDASVIDASSAVTATDGAHSTSTPSSIFSLQPPPETAPTPAV